MRLAIAAWSVRQAGGVEAYVAHVSGALAARGHDVSLWYRNRRTPQPAATRPLDIRPADGARSGREPRARSASRVAAGCRPAQRVGESHSGGCPGWRRPCGARRAQLPRHLRQRHQDLEQTSRAAMHAAVRRGLSGRVFSTAMRRPQSGDDVLSLRPCIEATRCRPALRGHRDLVGSHAGRVSPAGNAVGPCPDCAVRSLERQRQ